MTNTPYDEARFLARQAYQRDLDESVRLAVRRALMDCKAESFASIVGKQLEGPDQKQA